MFINDIFGDNDKKLDEVSNELLSRYKKAAGADASAADKRGDIERGNKRFSGIIKATKKQLANDVAGHKKSDVDEQAPQYTPKGVPLPTKQPTQQQPLNVPQGWEAKTQPDGSTRISKIGSMSSADYKQSMADYKAKNWTPEKMADYSQRMASGQGYSDAERAANYQQQQQHFGQYADQPVDEAGPFSYGAKKPRKGSVADLAAQKRKEQERGRQPIEPKDQRVGVARVVKEYGDTAKGQKMLTKVHKRAVDRLIKADDKNRLEPDVSKRDLKTVRKNQATADRAWDRFTDIDEQGVAEGGFDIPEIPRAPQPRPQPKEKTSEDKKLSDQEKQSLRQTVKDVDYTKPPTDTKARLSPEEKKELRQTVKDYEYPKPTNEASAREKLDRRFQELRKKRGAPDPEYYKELGKSYDIENDQERYARQAEIKKKYQVKEARRAEANFNVEDLKRLEQIRDLPTLKAQAMALISKPSERPMKPEKVAWFDAALDRMDSRMAIIKLMYDLLLSGEGHQVIGSKRSMNPNSYRSRFGESTIANEDVEKYVEELGRAGYEIVNERKMTCPECGGAAYADEMLAEKQDACYHKVKSRYKVWPSAYASGALVRCRKKGAKNWGNKSKK